MSAKIMGQVFDHVLSASEQLVLLALADHADHTGENAWPSIELLAWKTSMTERGVWGILRRLERRGALVEQRAPGYHRPRTWRIVLSALPRKAPLPRTEKDERRSAFMEERSGEKDERRAAKDERMRSYKPSSEPSSETGSALFQSKGRLRGLRSIGDVIHEATARAAGGRR